MDALQGVPPGFRRFAALKPAEVGRVERGRDRAGARCALGMAGTGIVAGSRIVDEEQCGHIEYNLPAAGSRSVIIAGLPGIGAWPAGWGPSR